MATLANIITYFYTFMRPWFCIDLQFSDTIAYENGI